ncbi:hypothetical protein JD82_00457 [Prauserella rugosa]|uniref:Uncharacterized protein n=1 Tax=Prauserella rugosa TaxID=43354 RepID=A0A660C5M8_9PSEU|nr:hypothetical protein JD82_00457 [Prauserella rugosa]
MPRNIDIHDYAKDVLDGSVTETLFPACSVSSFQWPASGR